MASSNLVLQRIVGAHAMGNKELYNNKVKSYIKKHLNGSTKYYNQVRKLIDVEDDNLNPKELATVIKSATRFATIISLIDKKYPRMGIPKYAIARFNYNMPRFARFMKQFHTIRKEAKDESDLIYRLAKIVTTQEDVTEKNIMTVVLQSISNIHKNTEDIEERLSVEVKNKDNKNER